MPELPDLTIYLEAIERKALGSRLMRIRCPSFTLLRTYDPPLSAVEGLRLVGTRRLGKLLVLAFEENLYLAFHLMIAGRFRWLAPSSKIPGKVGHAALDFETGTLLLTEQGSQKRAQLHVLKGEAALSGLDRGGIEPLHVDLDTFRSALARESRTLKRALTDPATIAGIGNAYSDEILHWAKLSPLLRTSRLSEEDAARLHQATREVLTEWTKRLRKEIGDGFPGKVTAFRPDFAVHGRYGMPCPECGSPVQRLVRSENEVNYCATCQTGGTVYADRALSRLLKGDWPRTLEEWEEMPRPATKPPRRGKNRRCRRSG